MEPLHPPRCSGRAIVVAALIDSAEVDDRLDAVSRQRSRQPQRDRARQPDSAKAGGGQGGRKCHGDRDPEPAQRSGVSFAGLGLRVRKPPTLQQAKAYGVRISRSSVLGGTGSSCWVAGVGP